MRAGQTIKVRATPSPVAELFADLGHFPYLPGARCRGRSDLYDRTVPDVPDRPVAAQALHEALRICRDECPCLVQCVAWFNSTDPVDRPHGVVAGRINNTWTEGLTDD